MAWVVWAVWACKSSKIATRAAQRLRKENYDYVVRRCSEKERKKPGNNVPFEQGSNSRKHSMYTWKRYKQAIMKDVRVCSMIQSL